MTKEAWAHNEWLRMYIQEPETFLADFQTVTEFLNETSSGKAPSYGERCEAFMNELIGRAPETEEERAKSFNGFDPDWS